MVWGIACFCSFGSCFFFGGLGNCPKKKLWFGEFHIFFWFGELQTFFFVVWGFGISFGLNRLDEKYKKGNLTAIINNFFVYMEKSRNRQMVSHTMYSNNLLSSFRIWLKENIQFFNT